MTNVYCFSGSGHSLAVADFLADKLNCEVTEIHNGIVSENTMETSIVVFPVYCQNIPRPVKMFLKQLTSKYVILIATYGKISYGNVLHEAAKMLQGQVIAGAYVPTGHTFLNESTDSGFEELMPVLERIKEPQKAVIPKSHKNILSNIFPALRSRISVRITRTNACRMCNACARSCPMNAINNGNIGSDCIRCMRCVTNCPNNALRSTNQWILKKYLNHYHKNEFKLYM